MRQAALRGPTGPVANNGHIQNIFNQGRQQPMVQERGCYFVADILMQETDIQIFRLPANYLQAHASLVAVAELMGLSSPEALQTAFGRPVAVNHPFGRGGDQRASYGNTGFYLNSWIGPPPAPVNLPDMIGLPLPQPVQMQGPDIIPHPVRRPRFHQLIDHNDLGITLRHIFHQFLHDVMMKVPVSRKRRESYLTLSLSEHSHVTVGMFSQPVLPFTNVSILYTEVKRWYTNFDRLFPDKDHRPSHVPSHFPQCLYHQAWLYVISRLSDNAAREYKRYLEVLFDQLSWVPHCDIANLWHTGTQLGSRRWHTLGTGEEGPRPRVIANPHVYSSMAQVKQVFSLRPLSPAMSKDS